MTSISLDLSEKIDSVTKELYRIIDQVTNELVLEHINFDSLSIESRLE